MADAKKKDIGALWAKTTSNGKRLLSGTINGQRVVAWANENKTNPKAPDWRLYEDTYQAPVKQPAPSDSDDEPAF